MQNRSLVTGRHLALDVDIRASGERDSNQEVKQLRHRVLLLATH